MYMTSMAVIVRGIATLKCSLSKYTATFKGTLLSDQSDPNSNLGYYEDAKRRKIGGQKMLRHSPLHDDPYLDIIFVSGFSTNHVSSNYEKLCHAVRAQVYELTWDQIHELFKPTCLLQYKCANLGVKWIIS